MKLHQTLTVWHFNNNKIIKKRCVVIFKRYLLCTLLQHFILMYIEKLNYHLTPLNKSLKNQYFVESNI